MPITIAAFYRFVRIEDPGALQARLDTLCGASGIKGTILIAPEGINATVSGTDTAIDALLLCDAVIDPLSNWQAKHHKALRTNYQKARYFKEYQYLLEDIYLARTWSKISDLNIFATKLIAGVLGIRAEWHRSSDLRPSGSKNGERAIQLCKALRCDYFINGPSARAFMDPTLFLENGIELDYMSYSYPEYEQLFPPFVHEVTALDVIFNCGPDARKLVCTRQEA